MALLGAAAAAILLLYALGSVNGKRNSSEIMIPAQPTDVQVSEL